MNDLRHGLAAVVRERDPIDRLILHDLFMGEGYPKLAAFILNARVYRTYVLQGINYLHGVPTAVWFTFPEVAYMLLGDETDLGEEIERYYTSFGCVGASNSSPSHSR